MKIPRIIFSMITVYLLTLQSVSAVVVLDTLKSAQGAPGNSASISGFDISSGANLLIAVFSGRPDAVGTSDTSFVSSVTYNGGAQSFTRLTFEQVNASEAEIWYLANPTDTAGTDVTFNFVNPEMTTRETLLGVYSLENAETNAANWIFDGVSGSNADPSITLSNVPADSFYIDAYGQGRSTTTMSATGLTRDGVLYNGGTDDAHGFSSYGAFGSAGDLTAGVDDSDPAAYSYVGVAVTPIPEPSSLGLILGVLGMVLLRRRRG